MTLKGHIPKNQFSRPGVDLTRHGRVWKKIPVSEVRPGDRVADFGFVQEIMWDDSRYQVNSVTLKDRSGGFQRFEPGAIVNAFVKQEGA